MSFFQTLPKAPPDPILGLTEAYQLDRRPFKINLGVGSYKAEGLLPYLLKSVKNAEKKILEEETDKEYLPISGDGEYLKLVAELVFGETVDGQELFAAQSVGGQGALRVAAELLARWQLVPALYLPDPTWPNHRPTFASSGLQVETYPYYDRESQSLDFERMLAALSQISEGNAVLFHGCCHNPTGVDLNKEQWEMVCSLLVQKKLLPIIDLAYQGLGDGLEADAAPVRLLMQSNLPLLVAYSFSKNMGLYGERIGALFIKGASLLEASHIGSQVKVIIRTLYSNPPCHGARIVKKILQDPSLTHLWKEELNGMRERLLQMRRQLASLLKEKNVPWDVAPLVRERGLFSFLPLQPPQVRRLIEEFGIYMPSSGRMSVAGLSTDTLPYVADAVMKVVRG